MTSQNPPALDLTEPDQIDFLSKLDTKNFLFDPSGLTAAQSGIASQFGGVAGFDAQLSGYGTNISDPAMRKVFPRTWEDFANAVGVNSGNADTTALEQGFFAEYLQILQITQGDWQGVDANTLQTQFQEAFTSFLEEFTFNIDKNTDGTPGPTDGAAGPTAYFLEQWHKWMTVFALNQTSLAEGNYANLSVFEQIFRAFFPNGTQEDFITMRNQMMQDIRDDHEIGFFLPSHFIAKWYATVQTAYLNPILGASSVDLTHSARMSILWVVFKLAVDMIGSLEKLSTVIAGRLNFLTSYQKAYTDLMAEIPVFTKGDGSVFGGTDESSASARQDLNPKNQTLTQNLQSYRDLIGDQAKQIQSNLNQLNESVNQQASLADSILQQMETILQGIFR